jgi:glucose/mannose transport system permease protein
MTSTATEVIPAPPSSERRRPRKGTPKTRAAIAVRLVLLVLFLVVVLIPAYVLVVTSFKSFDDALSPNRWALPSGLSLQGWSAAWTDVAPALLRTGVLAVPAAAMASLLGSMNGFVLSRWRFPGANVVFTLMLFGMFIPYQAVMVPLIELLPHTHLPSGIAQLMLVHTVYGIPICTLIFRNYYQSTIPPELIEAARVDGAGLLRTFRSLILPLSVPGFVVTMIWEFTSIWNDYLFAVFLSSKDNGPVILRLANIAGSQIVPYPQVMAEALLVTLPTLLVYIVLGRWFVGGLMAGAVKN